MKRIIIAAACALLAVFGLTACGGGNESTFTTPSVQPSNNANGEVLTINLAELSENINYVSSQIGVEVPTIDSLGLWGNLKQDEDDNGTFSYRLTVFDNDAVTPSFAAAVYDSSGLIKETRTEWDSSGAQSNPDLMKGFVTVQIMATTGLDADVAGMMYETAKASPYTIGTSKQLTYAFSGSYRCYYMISGGYHIVAVEPFAESVQKEDLEDDSFRYMEVTAAGATEYTGAGAATQSATDGTVSGAGGTNYTDFVDGKTDAAGNAIDGTGDAAAEGDAATTDGASTTDGSSTESGNSATGA